MSVQIAIDVLKANSRALKKKTRKNLETEFEAAVLQQLLKKETGVKARLRRKLQEKGLQSQNPSILCDNGKCLECTKEQISEAVNQKINNNNGSKSKKNL